MLNCKISSFLPFTAFLIPVFSALRLAKFNIDTRQTNSFIGLPTPANAILIASFPLIAVQQYSLIPLDFQAISKVLYHPYLMIVFSIVFSYLLVSPLPLFSLKFHTSRFKDNFFRYLFLIISIIFLILLGVSGIPIIVISYLGISFFEQVFYKKGLRQ